MTYQIMRFSAAMPLAGTLFLAACSGLNEQPTSPDVYRQTLTTATARVNTALAGIRTSKTLQALTEHVSAAEQAADQSAAGLGAVTPPQDVRAEHADLVHAFRQLHADLATAREGTEAHKLCAAPAVVTQLGTSLAMLSDSGKVLAAKGAAYGYRVDLSLPPVSRQQNRTLASGQFVRQGQLTGRGKLTIDNGRGQDAVVTLASGRHPAFSVYVRKGSKHKVTGIRDGTYLMYFAGGVDWDPAVRAFTRDCTFVRFDDSLKFETSQIGTKIRSTTWTITLQPVVGGTASTTEVDPSELPPQ